MCPLHSPLCQASCLVFIELVELVELLDESVVVVFFFPFGVSVDKAIKNCPKKNVEWKMGGKVVLAAACQWIRLDVI